MAQRTRLLALGVLLILPWSTTALAQDEEPTFEIPEVVVTDTPPLPTEPPPPPTEAPPPPTDIPAPTEVPVEPTQAPDDATLVPPDSEEEIDDSADVPTEDPNLSPSPTPDPTPTAEPAIPFAPVVHCSLIDAGEPPVAGESAWSFQDCAVTWDTENVTAVEARAWSDSSGWEVIVVNATALESQDVLDSSDGLLDLTDSKLEDDGFLGSRFLIGTRLGCSSATTTVVNLDLVATSTAPVPEDEDGNPLPIITVDGEAVPAPPGETVIETVQLRDLVLDANPAMAPTVSIVAASFTPIDLIEGKLTSTGTLEVAYSDAPRSCAWQISITYGDLTGGEISIPTTDLVLVEFAGLGNAAVSVENGSFTVSHTGSAEAHSGSFTIRSSLELSDPVPTGEYSASITVSAMVMP